MFEVKKQLTKKQNLQSFYYIRLLTVFLDYHLNKLYLNKILRKLLTQFPSLKSTFLTELRKQLELFSLVIKVLGTQISSKLCDAY